MRSDDLNDDIGPLEPHQDAHTPQDIDPLRAPNLVVQRVLQGVAAAMILALSVFITASVIMRYSGNGILGAVEIAALSMVLITVLVIPATTVADENFRVELADFFLSIRSLSHLNIFNIIVQLFVSLFLAAATIQLLLSDLAMGTTIGGELSLPRWWVTLPITIGFLGLVYSSILVTMSIRKSSTRHTESTEG